MTAPTLPPVEDERTSQGPRRPRVTTVGLTVRRFATSMLGRINGASARRSWLLGPISAAWVACIGLVIAAVPLLVVWMATPESGLTWLESLHVAGLLWVVAHGTPIVAAGVTYSLLPWGLAIIPAVLMVYAGGWAARSARAETIRDVGVVVASASVTYAVIVGVVVQLTVRPDARVSAIDAVVHSLLLGILAFGFGALRGSAIDVRRFVPAPVAVALRAGIVAALILLGLGALAATAALIVRVDDAVTLTQSLHPGVWGGLALTALGIAYVPVLIVWATSYVVGAGVMIGPAITVSPFVPATASTDLPPFPLLAALPSSAGPIAWALPLAGIVAGVLAGVVISRRARAESRLARMALALGAAAVAGVVMFVLAYLASGSLGDLRLANLGPSPTTVAVLVFVLVTLGAVPSAVVASPPAPPKLAVADPTEPAGSADPAVPEEHDADV
ncbi:MAG: DUF6350 family protein [bacterium]|nr:DUF6350 family protein [bacterium]